MSSLTWINRIVHNITQYISWFFHAKTAIITVAICALLLPVWVLIQVVIIPATSCGNAFSTGDTITDVQPLPDSLSDEEFLHYAQEIGILEREKAYLGSLLSLARQDSVYINLNLSDSLISLLIKGVTVRQCTLHEIKVTRRLECLNETQLLHWVSSPFVATADISTIPKIRYMIKEAPKDTTEAANQNTHPLLPDTSAVYFTLFFTRHLVIEINQLPDSANEQAEVIKAYLDNKRKASRQEAVHALLHFTHPSPEMLIRLTVSKADARAIYRGIPVFPGLALKMNE